MYLSIHPENKLAQKLYESIGFHLTGEMEDEWLHGKGFVMKRILTNKNCHKRVASFWQFLF